MGKPSLTNPKWCYSFRVTDGARSGGAISKSYQQWLCFSYDSHKKASTKDGTSMFIHFWNIQFQNAHGINKIQIIFRINWRSLNERYYLDSYITAIFQEGIPIKWVYRQFTENVSLGAILIKGNIIYGKYVLNKTRTFNLSWLVDTQTNQTILQIIWSTEMDKY